MAVTSDKAPRKFKGICKSVKKGLIIVHTGKGEGKSTAAFGTVVRALGWGHKVGIVQFMKGPWKTGEVEFLRKFPGRCDILSFGNGFTWDTRDFAKDVQLARKAWKQCCAILKDKQYFLVVFDEINYAMKYNFLDVKKVVRELRRKPVFKHVMLTGNGAPGEIIRIADQVTEMKCIKHPYQKGINAQPGIDY